MPYLFLGEREREMGVEECVTSNTISMTQREDEKGESWRADVMTLLLKTDVSGKPLKN